MQWYANEYMSIWGCNIDTRTLWSKLEMWSYHSWQDCNVLIIKWFNEYHLHQELVTEDIQYEDPLIRVEGFQEVENLSSAFRWKCYTLEIVKMKQAVSEIYLIFIQILPFAGNLQNMRCYKLILCVTIKKRWGNWAKYPTLSIINENYDTDYIYKDAVTHCPIKINPDH